jgi:hypothetical protein
LSLFQRRKRQSGAGGDNRNENVGPHDAVVPRVCKRSLTFDREWLSRYVYISGRVAQFNERSSRPKATLGVAPAGVLRVDLISIDLGPLRGSSRSGRMLVEPGFISTILEDQAQIVKRRLVRGFGHIGSHVA